MSTPDHQPQPMQQQQPGPQYPQQPSGPQFPQPGAQYPQPGAPYPHQSGAEYPQPGARYPQPAYAAAAPRPPIGGLSIATLVVSFFAGLVAVVLGVFALRQNWVRGTRGTGLAWTGIIVGAVLGVAQTWVFMLIFWAASNSVV